jgi:hypothetical protein
MGRRRFFMLNILYRIYFTKKNQYCIYCSTNRIWKNKEKTTSGQQYFKKSSLQSSAKSELSPNHPFPPPPPPPPRFRKQLFKFRKAKNPLPPSPPHTPPVQTFPELCRRLFLAPNRKGKKHYFIYLWFRSPNNTS